jgi:DNA ligase-1
MNQDTLYKRLYKLNTNGSTQVWEIHRNDNSYWSVTGKLNGKMIIGEPTLVTPKQKRTLDEQVVFRCDSQIKKKKDKKYVENIKDIHRADDDLAGYSAMLAHDYEKHGHKITFPCLAQAKLDGIRNLCTATGFYSRGRKKFTSCTHIWSELQTFFKDNPQARLDGEFYTHEYKDDFEQICSAVKKTAKKAKYEHLKLQLKVQYWLYDTPRIGDLTEKDKFSDRYRLLSETFKDYKYVKVLPTSIAFNKEQLIKLKEAWIEEGYEGIIIRNMAAPYEGKRSYNLLKWKDFIDEEFEIVGVNEGKGKLAEHAASFTCKMKDGKLFDAKLRGSFERLKYLYLYPEEVIGKMATVRYQNLTSEGLPRFPVMQAIRDYE